MMFGKVKHVRVEFEHEIPHRYKKQELQFNIMNRE